MKPFNLEAAKRGEPIVTRDGREAKLIAYVPELMEGYGVVYRIDGILYTAKVDGSVTETDKHRHDLFMGSTPRPQWQQDLIDAAKAGKVVEFKDLSGEWQRCLLTDFPESWNYCDSRQDRYRIRPEKVTRYLWAIKNDVVNKPYWFSGQMFMTKNEVDEAYSNFEHKRLDWSATDFEE